ncbi:uncharacterized protein G2W53_006572 [Senna tora]|uniref:Uncharacterized protein n=1 Tax=Senna tora TaxID=362788 RepID=A0A834X5B5_9FABA|nr:uncharacterized protein G2W53_006572 [Senna tora]
MLRPNPIGWPKLPSANNGILKTRRIDQKEEDEA